VVGWIGAFGLVKTLQEKEMLSRQGEPHQSLVHQALIIRRKEINTKQASKINWSAGVIIGSSIPIALIIIGIITELVSWLSARIHFVGGPVNTTIENAVLFGGLYFALPCGMLNIIVGIFARSRGLVKKKVAITGIVIGVLGILIGLLSWSFFIAVSSFVF
jgi:hypothetical protein